MARGFVEALNLFESQDAKSARSILDNLAGSGINLDVRLFANNLNNREEVNITEYNIEIAQDVLYTVNNTVATSGCDITDYYIFVVATNRRDIVPFSNDTVLFVIDNDGSRRFHIVKNSDTLKEFQLFNLDGVTVGTRNSWADFSLLENKTLYIDDSVLLANMTNFSKDRPVLNDGSNPEASFVPIDPDLTDDPTAIGGTPAVLTAVDPDNNFLKATSYATYTDDIDDSFNQFYFKESSSILSYRHNSYTRPLTLDGFVKITNDDNISFDPEDPEFDDTTFPGLYIVANGISKRAFSDTTNPWNQEENRRTNPRTSLTLDMLYVDSNVVGDTDVQVLKLKMVGPRPSFNFYDSDILVTAASTPVVELPQFGGFTHKMEVEINGETMYLLLTANN